MHDILTAGPANYPARSGADPPVSHPHIVLIDIANLSTNIHGSSYNIPSLSPHHGRAHISPVLVPLRVVLDESAPTRSLIHDSSLPPCGPRGVTHLGASHENLHDVHAL